MGSLDLVGAKPPLQGVQDDPWPASGATAKWGFPRVGVSYVHLSAEGHNFAPNEHKYIEYFHDTGEPVINLF